MVVELWCCAGYNQVRLYAKACKLLPAGVLRDLQNESVRCSASVFSTTGSGQGQWCWEDQTVALLLLSDPEGEEVFLFLELYSVIMRCGVVLLADLFELFYQPVDNFCHFPFHSVFSLFLLLLWTTLVSNQCVSNYNLPSLPHLTEITSQKSRGFQPKSRNFCILVLLGCLHALTRKLLTRSP